MPQRRVLAMMPMPHRLCQSNRQAIGADALDRAFLEQAVIGAGSDRNVFAGAPVDRLRQAKRVVTRRSAVAKRHPGSARLAVQIDCSAVQSRQELAAQLRMCRGAFARMRSNTE